MNIRIAFLFAITFLGTLETFAPAARGADDSRPNIIVILTDDGGYSDFSCYGNKDYPYLTEAFADESIRFMGDNQDKPFFIYLAFNAVHGPLHAKQADYDKLDHIKNRRRRTYAAMHLSLDRQVGRILDYLEAENLAKNTLLFFVNDNGGPLNMGARNGNLRGQKGTCMEGGIRVPFMVQWPGKFPAGLTYDQPVISLDIFTTAVAAAGGKHRDSLDGVNLLPFLSGETAGAPHERLYWRRSFYSAIREGDWKLVHLKDRLPMLFDLKSDPSERNDLALQQSGRAQDLIKKLYLWETELEHPLWHTDAKYLKDNTEKHDAYEMSDELKAKPTVIR